MESSTVLATVNGKDITQQDVYDFLKQLPPQTAMQFQSQEGIKKVADELVNQEVLYLNAIENKFNEEEGFKATLEKVKENVLKQYAVNKLLSGVSVTEEEMTKYYDEHKQQFAKPESIRASHILVKEEEKANEIVKEINEGLSFEEAAKKYSMCPSKSNGGDLGEFTKGKMVPEFEEAAFNLKEGELSEPVKTQFGYHLIKVKSKTKPSIRKFEEVKSQINKQIVTLKQQNKYLNKTKELRNKYEIKINF